MTAHDDTAEIPVVAAPVPAAITSHRAPRRRRRWPWVTAAAFLVVLGLLAAGGLWYLSGLIGDGARVSRAGETFPLIVTAVGPATVTYAGDPGGWTDQGLMGVATIEGGYVQTSTPEQASRQTTRTVTSQVLPPTPAGGEAATLDAWYFPRNPLVGLGLAFKDVLYDSPLGPTPAWLIPGTSTTWVIFTHGRGATPAEGLRIASTVSPLGYPMLLIKYRDDARAPFEDGIGGFGAQEWPDLEGAVQYALDHGATRVVLAGASMGGSITLAFLENSPLASSVVGAFLDSPVTDFGQVVRDGAADRAVPAVAATAAMQVAAWRYSLDWEATDYTARAADLRTPIVIVQGTADDLVRPAVNQEFATAADPGVVTVELFEGAGHVQSWNVDRPRYERLLRDFLGRVAAVP